MIKNAILFISIIFTFLANAESIVTAQCGDHGFSYYEYRFNVEYRNPDLEAGSRVEIIKSYSGTGSFNSGPYREEWMGVERETLPMQRNADGNFVVPLRLFFMATGGYLSGLDFAYRITRSDGTVVWDNGSNQPGYESNFYRAKFFILGTQECWHLRYPANLESIPMNNLL